MLKTMTAALLLCALALPLCAAETLESMATRVRELEKANVALKQDMAQTQLVLDTARTDVKTLKRQLDEAQGANKTMRAELDALKKQQTDQQALLTALQARLDADAKKAADAQQGNATSFTAVNARLDKLDSGLAAQAQKHDKDLADVRKELVDGLAKLRDDLVKELTALKESVAQQFAALRNDLDKERAERITADNASAEARAKLAKEIKSNRTMTYVMGGVLGGLTLMK